ncbi:helix-turn-helix transcriptional regulator [Parvularcula flava]|uniref:Helix-turn-helix transcriptional regulator n=2 Tax=Aquisalinus luteolus TaxID=1566827 RepID=A0ABX0HNN0_9PROT|nr:helix-turn-helix transcriptional regulator [Aquisalinus luteolus]
MSRMMHPRTEDLTLATVLYALGDPVRLQIVRSLQCGAESCCGALLEGEDVPKSTQSHHMRILREAGIIRSRKEGRQYMNCLRRDDLNQRFPGLLDAVLTVPH